MYSHWSIRPVQSSIEMSLSKPKWAFPWLSLWNSYHQSVFSQTVIQRFLKILIILLGETSQKWDKKASGQEPYIHCMEGCISTSSIKKYSKFTAWNKWYFSNFAARQVSSWVQGNPRLTQIETSWYREDFCKAICKLQKWLHKCNTTKYDTLFLSGNSQIWGNTATSTHSDNEM